MICVFHALLYAANVRAGRVADADCRLCSCCSNELLLLTGLFASFCLSWVGAICDDDDGPMCMGNNSIHSLNAVLFFFLTDVVAAVLLLDPKTDKARHPTHRRIAGAIFAAMVAARAVRWAGFVYPGWQLGDNACRTAPPATTRPAEAG